MLYPILQLVEKIMDCSRAGKLQEVVAEKRSVLTSMQQVLQSCYALLDSTQVPLHSIIRLLQHILRYDGSARAAEKLQGQCTNCPALPVLVMPSVTSAAAMAYAENIGVLLASVCGLRQAVVHLNCNPALVDDWHRR